MNRRSFLSFIGLAPITAPLATAGTLTPAASAAVLSLPAAEILRDHAIAGEPTSGAHPISKRDLREWCGEIERALSLTTAKPASPKAEG